MTVPVLVQGGTILHGTLTNDGVSPCPIRVCVHASPFSGRNNTEPTYDGAALLDKTLTNDEAAT